MRVESVRGGPQLQSRVDWMHPAASSRNVNRTAEFCFVARSMEQFAARLLWQFAVCIYGRPA